MKPTYENQADAENERQLALLLENKWKCKMQRQMKYAQFDYVALRGKKIQAFVEMRHRNVPYDQYPTCFISLTKLLMAQNLKNVCDVPCLFVVQWSDRTGYCNLDMKCEVEFSGEGWNRRNDPSDIEAIGLIPTDRFVMIN